MFYTHVEYFALPNTPEGRSVVRDMESNFFRLGIRARVNTTTTGITIGYEELVEFKPPELEVMREPEKGATNDG